MGQISKLKPEAARFDPESQFDGPDGLVEAAGLNLGQKFATLQRWRGMVEDRLAATGEGMPSNGTTRRDLTLLEQLAEAEKRLEDEHRRVSVQALQAPCAARS